MNRFPFALTGIREERRLWVSSDVEWLPKVEDWPQVSSIALIEHERDTYESKSTERRFFISSLSWRRN
jgi:hypothetical protein